MKDKDVQERASSIFSLNKNSYETLSNFVHLYFQSSTSAWHPQQLSADNDNYGCTAYLTLSHKSTCKC